MDMCIDTLTDGVAQMLADAVVRAGLAYNTPPPDPATTTSPPSTTSTAPEVVAYKAPPAGFGPSAKSSAVAGSSTTGLVKGPMSAEEFLRPPVDEGFVKAPPPRPLASSTTRASESAGHSPAAKWQSDEDQRTGNRAGYNSPIAWQVRCHAEVGRRR